MKEEIKKRIDELNEELNSAWESEPEKKAENGRCILGEKYHQSSPSLREGTWEEEFYELTKSMDGQFRPKLKLLIEKEISLSRSDGQGEGYNKCLQEFDEDVAEAVADKVEEVRKELEKELNGEEYPCTNKVYELCGFCQLKWKILSLPSLRKK